jgi:hypothetical protein
MKKELITLNQIEIYYDLTGVKLPRLFPKKHASRLICQELHRRKLLYG